MTTRSPQAADAKTLLDSLRSGLEDNGLSEQQQIDLLTRLKILGRTPNIVAPLYDEFGIRVLQAYGFDGPAGPAALEANRCLANALLTLPSTRKIALRLALDKQAARALQKASLDAEFVLSRILFLLTLDSAINVEALILDCDLVPTIFGLLSQHALATQESSANKPSTYQSQQMALSETLKLLFNLTSAKSEQVKKFGAVMPSLVSILNHTVLPQPPLQPPINHTIHVLANIQVQEDDFKDVSSEQLQRAVETITTILQDAITRYSSTELDTLAVPLLTILRTINENADATIRQGLKLQYLPQDEERDLPLGHSSSLASRLLRLTTSSGLLHLTEAISGFMFELSNKDANEYVKNIGYGYAAGYLMSHKIPVPDSAKITEAELSSDTAIPFNPITGQRVDREPVHEQPAMSREEKEREAERLFVLFERLKATGVVDVKNPVEVARDEGRFEELSDSDSG
ncbi:hypothetical protein PV10_02086 [Exophiala mesophila]|uniref:Synembryn-A n=1 Tax=Exophiala mesophila TaxID=212818 RepID=A0A0D1WXX0_EXOME|nr:uncharacterized protein PV10_02086 [Exophiala mesophila]KIV94310.1 hypothetical protein PV10_02086 [Exophiala mesophila]